MAELSEAMHDLGSECATFMEFTLVCQCILDFTLNLGRLSKAFDHLHAYSIFHTLVTNGRIPHTKLGMSRTLAPTPQTDKKFVQTQLVYGTQT